MIVHRLPNYVAEYIQWLNDFKACATIAPCEIVFIEDAPAVQNPDTNETGFAVYIWGGRCLMYVAGDLPDVSPEEKEDAVLEFITHEYVHHIQWCKRMEPNEDEAEAKAREWVESYRAYQDTQASRG